mgnify:CR=1 FL=1
MFVLTRATVRAQQLLQRHARAGALGRGTRRRSEHRRGQGRRWLLRRWWATDLADDLPEAHKYEFLDVVGEEALCYEVRASTRQKPSPATRAHATLVLVGVPQPAHTKHITND